MNGLTPMMKQYMEIKEQYKDCLLFFRMGDFYELFFEDADTASRELEITLTGRDCGLEYRAPMCGVPHHSADNYIDKLILKGYKVAICEQAEEASEAKGIVKREVVRVITPGTLTDTMLLEEKKNNYLMALYGTEQGWGITYTDVSTGELYCTEIKGEKAQQLLLDEVFKIQPKEVIYYPENEEKKELMLKLSQALQIYINPYKPFSFEEKYAVKMIKEHFNVLTPEGLGFYPAHFGIGSTGVLLDYLKNTQKRFLKHINKIKMYNIHDTMILDLSTRRNLELTETIREKSKKGTLLWVLDHTLTAMGGRKIRKWIEQPLLNVESINERLQSVETLKEDMLLLKELKGYLREIYDMERLAGKMAYGTVSPRDLIALKASLSIIPLIKNLIKDKKDFLLNKIFNKLNPLYDVADLIHRAIMEEPACTLKEGGIIKTGFNQEVDELKKASKEGKQWIARLEKEEKEKTGIKFLKVGFNKVFGYYIEVTNSNLSMVPDYFIRKQTLANCERFFTPQLKEIESKILGAEERAALLEYQLFMQIRNTAGEHIEEIQGSADALAELDALYSYAVAAAENRYNKPAVKDGNSIMIKDGRHPVVEKMLDSYMFVSNDTYMDQESHNISIITGPNMAGKSTYMRQAALIVLMAQAGSFVPASHAVIGAADRIFTRVGASDDLAQGQSTFMIEMSEMANILNCATQRSLLILDEIGRGTSTFDGLSIAWAVIEYLSQFVKAKTLFSTHYHELTELEGKIHGIKNYRISVKEDAENIVFLRKITEGSADKSYGIQAAKLAGLPQKVIQRAGEILIELEKNDIVQTHKSIRMQESAQQLSFEHLNCRDIIAELKEINLMETTPIDALNLLHKLQKKINV